MSPVPPAWYVDMASRLLFTGVTQGVTTASKWLNASDTDVINWHAFVSGTFGGASLQLQYSPDTTDTSDANSTWYAPVSLLLTSGGDTYFQAKPRKWRVVVTGGNGTTSLNVEVR